MTIKGARLSALVVAALLAGCASGPDKTAADTATATPTSSSATRAATPPPRGQVPPPSAPPAAVQSAVQRGASGLPATVTSDSGTATVAIAGENRFESFADWKQDFSERARAAGISAATLQTFQATARFLPRVVELDRAQPEFTRTAWQYLDGAVSAQRVTQGRKKLQDFAAPLRSAGERYGVPAQVIAAIWGMESNYGSNFGNISAINALSTLAFDGRRAQWASQELLAALRIIDNGDIDAAHLLGSWAGAMGHTQFLPSVFLRYAVDADGDGHRDIWGSIADVTASTANYLAQSGWNQDEPWGLEVRLPPQFDYARAELNVRANSSQWAAEGVQSVSGRPLPAIAGASIITPVGAHGPAFLVGTNFRAILRYNNSINYALAVSLLSDQLAGRPGVQSAWPRELAPLTREQMRQLQNALNHLGLDAGTADGVMGPATRLGLRRWQQGQGLQADGFPTQQLLQQVLQGIAPQS